jgi:chromosome segregation ATPase
MADALKEHIEQCPKHPMSVLKKENKRLTQKVKTLTACHLNMKDTDDLIADKVSLETKIGELRATIKSQDGDIRSLQENGVLTYQEESRLLGEDMQQLKQIILEWEERCSNLEGKISTKDKRRPSPQAIQKEQKEQLNQEEEN